MKRAYKYRFYPTPGQVELLAQTFGCVRFVYNSILRWRTDAYYKRQEKIGYTQARARLTALKKEPEFAWLNDVSSVPLQQALRHQQAGLSNFFAGRARYPTFKSKRHKQAATLTDAAFKYRDGRLYMAKSKAPLDVRRSRPLPSVPSTVTVSKDAAGRYFVSCLCESEPASLPLTSSMVGIDVGLKDVFVTDSGFRSGNPRHTAKYAARLALLQRRLSKKAKGSKNRARARLKVARLHAKIADCRMDALHKATRKLINENQVVCVESLKVKNMLRNPSLSKAIADAGWSEFVRQLRYKGEWAGRSVVAIEQFFPSSKRCSRCGFTMKKMPLDVRKWLCPECGADHDRDINAARNIKAAGLAVLACGEPVIPEPLNAAQVRLRETRILAL
ncbi:IS200/IS605 family element transposase accessory protein TnpB [Salmonella enterica subsp. diarizonae]|uniref:RNA-guided endonuclease InsQ/TnpB family protein n=1 Tax=Salmonella enterica TaxID=28901 RepID=UPI000DEC791B|nr:RNA-guided endonuclease TnpB family protein [Salmonella enterica]ECJ2587512.1 IS200/IS605 family element transposase accessory protein TnpB [Salmonella enterica subsp. diarizonae]AXD07547.1 transposase [Salmonella enterica]EBI9916407.1 transposase [Salmonella enterica]EEJ9054765.1 IS200/IS605 family element transposase accessory protein TnpB [Salmonella enterica subsp. diarizonae]EEP9961369.1 IS200/IS605 family element transposase accessory protein TnpB [Salmonella enterica]